ncbi:MAG: hypothetical protein ACRDYC_03840, partial [Acidimicrobiales bacterium]
MLAAHFPFLFGFFDPNPLLTFSSTAVKVRPGLLPGYFAVDPNAGYTAQALGHRAALDWLSGRFPAWNRFEGLGAPLIAGMQAAAVFLPLVLLLALPGGQLYFYLILDLVGAFCTLALARRMGINQWVAVAGAVGFGLNGTMAWFSNAPANPVCFLPLLLLGIEMVRDRTESGASSKGSGWWVVTVAIALSLFAGFPETAYLDGLLGAVWALARLGGLPHQLARRVAVRLGCAAVGGLLLAGPVLMPFAYYLPQAFLGPHAGGFGSTDITGAATPGLFFPYLYGPIDGFVNLHGNTLALQGYWGQTGGYLTLLLIALAAIGLLGTRYRTLRLCLGAWCVVMLGRSYGVEPFSTLVNLLPGATSVAIPRYVYPSVEMAVVILALFGLDKLVAERASRAHVASTVAVVAGLAALAALRGNQLVSGQPASAMGDWETWSLVWGFATLAAVTAFGLVGRGRVTLAVLGTLVAFEAGAMYLIPQFSAPTGGHTDHALVAFLQSHVGQGRIMSFGPISPDYGSYFSIATLNVNDLPVPKKTESLVKTVLDPNTSAVLFTGFSSNNPKGLTPNQAFADHFSTYQALGVDLVVELPGVAPLPNAEGVSLPLVYHDSLASVYRVPGATPFFSDAQSSCTPHFVSPSEAVVSCAHPVMLRRLELAMPGWSARAGGRSVRVQEGPLGTQEVRVPAGTSRVTFSYSVPGENLGLLCVIVVELTVIGLLAPEALRRRRERSEPRWMHP